LAWRLALLAAAALSLFLLLFKSVQAGPASTPSGPSPTFPCFERSRSRHFHVVPNDFHYGGASAREWFQQNWQPAFRCLDDQRVGNVGEGGKWLCDPDCLIAKGNCLVFSVGSNNQFDFEEVRLRLRTS
jgi:Methyltransferase domain